MGLLTREKKQKEQYANYEQQAPEREFYYRQATPVEMQGYAQYNNFANAPQYTTPYNAAPIQQPMPQPVQQQVVQPVQQPAQNMQNVAPQQVQQPPQFVASFYQNQASQYLSNGWVAPQQSFDNSLNYQQQQYQNDMLINQNYDYMNQTRRIVDQRSGVASKKKNVNADMIKIVVTIMVVALAICGMLIANQFMISGQAVADSGVSQSIESSTVASAVTADGTQTIDSSKYTIPAYEYEKSTNWFDKVCDFFGGKLN